jgi:hypothetical protein
MPVPLIRLVAGTMEALRIKAFPVATDQLRQLKFDNIGPVDAVMAELGWEPQPMEGRLTHLQHKVKDQEPTPA